MKPRLYKIETGIPIPEQPKKLGPVRTLIESLRVGQSVCVEAGAVNRSMLMRSRAATGFNFTTRTVENGYVRIWRTN